MMDFTYKICVFGDYNTGKTSFLNFLQDYKYVSIYEATIGVEFSSKIMALPDKKIVKVNFWDCAGQERFRSITHNFFKEITAGMLFFDVTCKKSFENLSGWIELFRKFNSENIPILLVGNKIDKDRVVEKGEAYKFACDNNLQYIEVSVKKGINISNSVNLIVDTIYKNNETNPNIRVHSLRSDAVSLLDNQDKRTRYCYNCIIS